MSISNIILSTSVFFLVLLSPSLATTPPSPAPAANTPGNFCSSTQYPKFCRSTMLPYGHKPGTLKDYGRISLRQSLSHAKKFLKLVNYFLRVSPYYFPSSVGALEDCHFLAQLNVDSLSYTLKSVNYTDTLHTLQAIDLQTLLSATLTNYDTCMDGLRTTDASSSVTNSLVAPISNGTKTCSISLALFDKGWIRHHKKVKGRETLEEERKHTFSELENGVRDGLPLRMSDWDRERYESLSERRLLLDQSTVGSSVNVSQMVVVNKKGGGNFTTINDAVAAAPDNTTAGSGYFVIYVVKGNYEDEYVSIPTNKRYIMMIGEGIGRTIITGNRSVVDGWTTFNSSTFAVVGQGFVGINMTFRNTAGAIKHQAVAVRNGADMSAFYSCGFEGYQDTLYTHSLRQLYRDCEVYGTVDYIFGNAAVVLQNCRINSRLPMSGQFNAITAQGRTDPNQNTGISIHNCSIKAAKDLANSNATVRTYLGRPWKLYSTTIFMNSSLSSLIEPTGWAPWNGSFALDTLYYAEFNNTGAGAKTEGRVTWPGFHVLTNATDAYNFTVGNFTQGDAWLPQTGVPYTLGLI